MKKILITGCSGFIGRHAVNYAIKKGYGVVGFDLNPNRTKHRNFRFVKGDINDKAAVHAAAKGCDYILHLAAMTSLPDFQYDLYKNYGTNTSIGFLNVIDAAKSSKCRKFVYASSSAVYLDKYGEDDPIDIISLRNHYGKSKLMDDMLAQSYIDSSGLKAVGLRYFNIYGPGEDVKLRPSPITKFKESKVKDGTITIFGDGKQAKDFIYIEDAIKITFKLLESSKSCGVYNVGTGVATSFNSIAEYMKPKKIIYMKNPYLSSYIFYLKADTKKLLRTIGKYRFMTMKQGVAKLMKT